MGRKKSLENRREIVIDSARTLFGRYGFERTTIDDIAKDAGVGKGSVYLEFPNKQEILFAIIGKFVEERKAQIEHSVEVAKPPYLKALNKILVAHALAVYERATSQIHTPDALLHTNIEIKKRFKKHFLFMETCIETMLEKASRNGEIKKSADFNEITETLLIGMSPVCPPYLRNTKTNQNDLPTRKQIEKESTILIKLLIAGIKHEYGK